MGSRSINAETFASSLKESPITLLDQRYAGLRPGTFENRSSPRVIGSPEFRDLALGKGMRQIHQIQAICKTMTTPARTNRRDFVSGFTNTLGRLVGKGLSDK